MAEQWRDDLRRHARQGRINYSHYDWKTSRIAVAEDRVVAHFGVYNLTMRVGSALVATAGVNLVVTAPDFRKRGLMPATIRASMEAMREQGYDMSVVCNAIANYYTRFGYVSAWPECDFFVRTRDLPMELPLHRPYAFKPRSRQDLTDLFNANNRTVTGTVVRPTFLRTKEPDDLQGYTWRGETGETVGYVIFDVISNGKAIWYYDSAGDPDEQLRVLGLLARRAGCDEVRFNRLPYRSHLAKRLRTMNCTAELTYRPTGGWLVRIVNLRTVCEKLKEELSLRLRQSHMKDWQGDLLLSTGQEEVVLAIDNSSVSVREPGETRHKLLAGEALARLIIGSEEPDELIAAHNMELGGCALDLARVLFPAQQPQMGNADL